MTGDSEAAFKHRGVPDSRLLPKPFAPMELVRVVRSLVAADGGAAAPQAE
jgi:hypothetical protein